MKESQKEFLLMLAYLYLQNAKWDRALIVLRALRVLAPEDPQVARCLAYAALETGDGSTALREANTGFAVTNTPEEAEAGRLLKARAWWQLGLVDQAQRTLQSEA